MAVGSLIAAALAGVLTSLTPGLYPLIPLTRVALGPGPLRRLAASLFLCGAATIAWGLGGALAGGVGSLMEAPVHSAAGAGFLALLCGVMGSAVLGLVPLNLPPALAARLARTGGGEGPFVMMRVSLPVVAPWLMPQAAVLGALALRAGDPWAGAALAAAFAVGVSLPWIGIGASLARPPSGGVWMEVVRLLLASVIWAVGGVFVAQAWPSVVLSVQERLAYPAAWGLALLLMGSGSGALMLTSRRRARTSWLRSSGALLMTLGLYGVALEVSREVGLADAPPIAWTTQHEAALMQARAAGKPLVLDFTADWCQPCQQLERDTYVDPEVRRAAARFVMAKIDSTAMDEPIQALFTRYKIVGLPTVLFFDSGGRLLAQPRLTGYVGPQRFAELLRSVR